MKLVDEVDVYVQLSGEDVWAGSLRASFQGGRVLGGTSFEYSREYLQNSQAYAISPELPVRTGRRYTGEDAPLFGAFADAAPDDWGSGLIRARHGGTGGLGDFDFLTQANDRTRMGAIRLRDPESPDEWLTGDAHTGVREVGIAEIVSAADRFQRYEASEQDMRVLEFFGSSLGGARPKASVVHEGKLAILKLPSTRDGRQDGEAWEYVALQLARRVGIRTPRAHQVHIGEGKSGLLVERFDRDATGNRIAYLSASSAMELGMQRKATYGEFADTIAEFTACRDDLNEMFDRIALTVLINNVDDHWKNHGFVRHHESWRLSPVFDVNPTRTRGVMISRAISDVDDPTSRDLRHLLGIADAFGLSRDAAAQRLGRVATVVRTWPSVARKAGISAAEINDMAPAFSEQQIAWAESVAAQPSRTTTIDVSGHIRDV